MRWHRVALAILAALVLGLVLGTLWGREVFEAVAGWWLFGDRGPGL